MLHTNVNGNRSTGSIEAFKQAVMDSSPRCYMPSFVDIGLLVPEKKNLKCFTIYGHGGHIGHVTSIIFINYHFRVRLHTKCGF